MVEGYGDGDRKRNTFRLEKGARPNSRWKDGLDNKGHKKDKGTTDGARAKVRPLGTGRRAESGSSPYTQSESTSLAQHDLGVSNMPDYVMALASGRFSEQALNGIISLGAGAEKHNQSQL